MRGPTRLALPAAAAVLVLSPGCDATASRPSAGEADTVGYRSTPGHLRRPVDVPLRPYVGRLVTVDAVVAADTIRLLLDTGGGDTVIDPAVAEGIGCSPSGHSVGFRMSGEPVEFSFCPDVTLEIEGHPFSHEDIAVWDLGASLPDDLPPIDGVLSLKTFVSQPFTLRLSERVLTLETPESLGARVDGMSLLRSRTATGHDGDVLTVLVRGVDPDTAWYLVDSANLDLIQSSSTSGPGATRDEGDAWEDTLRLEGLPPRPAAFRSRSIIYDGVLSEEWMRGWVWTFDLAGGRVWAAPAPLDPARDRGAGDG